MNQNDSGVHGLSKLNEVAVRPRPVERQNISACLRVFCEETYTALNVHPSLNSRDVDGTAIYLPKIVDMWKILNSPGHRRANLYIHTEWNFIFEMCHWDLYDQNQTCCHFGEVGQITDFCKKWLKQPDFYI